MPTLYVAQYLCPQRHALCAIPYDLEETPREKVEEQLKAAVAVASGLLNPWCGICHSRDIRIEHVRLPTDDWDAAMEMLKAIERANILSRLFLESEKDEASKN